MTRQQGRVDIVGAGPGELRYLTMGAFQLLTQAEVLIYDALIHPTLLTQVQKSCICLSVGKRGGGPSTPQIQINRLLVQYARLGRRVVRLKCGDPFIFGRTASEIEALQAVGCRVQVWPGLSSVLAAPVLAGMPLTDPQLSRQLLVLSGHAPTEIDWETAVAVETLVLVMATHHLANIIEQLRRRGLEAERPIAVIQWGGWPQQQVWVGTLADIMGRLPTSSLSPAVVVVGEVVALRSQLRLEPLELMQPFAPGLVARVQSLWVTQAERENMDNEALPLAGQTILVTRAMSQSSEFCEQLQAAGARVMEQPALEIGPPSSWRVLDEALMRLSEFDWLILTSANGVDQFCDRLLARGQDLRSLSTVKIAVVGRKTAAALWGRGLQADFIPPDYVADSLVAHFPGGDDLGRTRILFPRVESGGREVLVADLTARGATVVEAPAYQSRCPVAMNPLVVEALRSQTIDVITFASSKTVRHFHQLLQQAGASTGVDGQTWLSSTQIASIGPQTSQTCLDCWGRVDIEAQEYTLDGLKDSIIKALRPQASVESEVV